MSEWISVENGVAKISGEYFKEEAIRFWKMCGDRNNDWEFLSEAFSNLTWIYWQVPEEDRSDAEWAYNLVKLNWELRAPYIMFTQPTRR